MKKIIIGLVLLGSISCQKQKDCQHWKMVVEDQQMQLNEANVNYIQNPSEENLTKINNIKQNLVLFKRNVDQYCD